MITINTSFKTKIFRQVLFYELSNIAFEENVNGFKEFTDMLHHGPLHKYVQRNNLPFMNKTF